MFLICAIPGAGAVGNTLTMIILLVDIIIQMSSVFSEVSCYLKASSALSPLPAEVQDWNPSQSKLYKSRAVPEQNVRLGL